MEHPACNRTERWKGVAPPPELADPSLPRSFCIQVRLRVDGWLEQLC